MKLGIMQPYFFPYVGHFALINQTDKWIVFDEVQYIERGWMNRNRIIHPTKPEATYINVPLEKHTQKTIIKDILINENEDFKDKIKAQLTASYKKRAPYFKETMKVVEDVFNFQGRSLTKLNTHGLQVVCAYLGITFDYQIFSEMELDMDEVNDAGDWALNISKAMNADIYINPISGKALFSECKFKEAGIKLEFLEPILSEYSQKKSCFLSGLSIIDVMMFNSIDEIKIMLDNFKCEVAY